MKVPITLSIEHEKKILFDSMKSIHGKTFSDILDAGIETCLLEISPVALVEEKILKAQAHLAELEQERFKAQAIEEQLKLRTKVVEQGDNVTDKYLEDMRNQKFEEFRDSTIKLWKKGDMNWSRIVDLYKFQNTSEAKEWFSRKIAEVEV